MGDLGQHAAYTLLAALIPLVATFALLLKALKGDGNTNVLSQPSLTTLDNQEAEFSVGQEVPFLTGSFSNAGANTMANLTAARSRRRLGEKNITAMTARATTKRRAARGFIRLDTG